jgi:hypothetical protein
MLICDGMILLDNLLQYLMFIAMIYLSRTCDNTAILICNALVMFMIYHWINTIKDELHATFVSLRNIVYQAILGVNLPGRLYFGGGGPPAGALQAHHYMSFELSFAM